MRIFNQHKIKATHAKISQEKMDSKEPSLSIVGGHKDSFSSCDKGNILLKKAVPTEQIFYENVFNNKLPIRNFMPDFFGVKKDELGISFLQLQNLTAGMQKPVIIDIKIGKHTTSYKELTSHGHCKITQATIKIIRDRTKDLIGTSHDLNFRIVCDSKSQTPRYKNAIKNPTKQLINYLPKDTDTCNEILRQLNNLNDFVLSSEFENYELIGSSLLIVYDEASIKENVKIALIDFAHSSQQNFPRSHKEHVRYVEEFRKGFANLVTMLSEASNSSIIT